MPATCGSPDQTDRKASPDSVIGRANVILGAFEDDAGSLGLSELARRAGLPKATVYRLAEDLVEAGLLERDKTGYRLGLRLFELGHHVAPQRTLREAAMPYMADLRQATRLTVNLAVLEGADVVYVESLTAKDPPPMNCARSGYRFPAHATGLGKALLANSPPDVLAAVLAQPLQRMAPRTIVDPAGLLESLRRAKADGIAYDLEESAPGIVCAASPIFRGEHLLAALSVSGRSHEVKLDQVTPAVRTSALAVSRAVTASRLPPKRRASPRAG